MKKISIIAVILAFILVFTGCKGNNQADNASNPLPTDQSGVPIETEDGKVTYSYNGATAILPNTFTDYTTNAIGADYTFLYAEAYVGLGGIEEFKDELNENITSLDSYVSYRAELVGAEPAQENGQWTMCYEDMTQNEAQMVVCVFHETEESFWIIQSYCTSDVYSEHEAEMWNYVNSVTFE